MRGMRGTRGTRGIRGMIGMTGTYYHPTRTSPPSALSSAFRSAATPVALELAGMTSDAALSKARMSALLVLGTRAQQGGGGNDDLPFKAIQQALDLPEDQV